MSIDTSIVRIRIADRTVVGAGFLVDEQHIFTCAHVVTQSLGLPEDIPDAPQAPIWLDFPLLAPKKLLTAKVVRWLPKQEDERGDIAVLELQGDLPEEAEPACFAEAEDYWNHPFRAFGFPIGQDDGVWATGQLLGKQATNWIMIEDVKAQGFAVMQGFSGGPVLDTQLQGVVGMVVASSRATEKIDTKTAFVIPLDVLDEAWEISSPLMSQRIFLSSAPGDAAFAQQLSDDLQKRGFVVWNEEKGPDGVPASGEESLQRAIRSAQAVVLVVSPQTRTSRTVNEHLRLASLYRRRLILVWVGDDPDAKPQRYGWRETTWIDAHQTPYSSALETLEASLSQDRLISITALLGPSDDRPEPEPRNPYKGLRVFTADDTKDFFGRDRFVNELVKDVQELLATDQVTPAQGRLLALIGPSGSGKSSVLMAGLLPKLQHDALPGSAKWIYLEPMVPGKHPLETLALELKSYFPESSIKTLREDLDDDATRGLHLLATQMVKKSDTRVVLLVDQFEELFTQTESEAERQQFIELLLTSATEPHGPVVVLLTIRADFYDRPMQYPALNRLLQAHLRQVLPMDVEDLRATIEQPAAQSDVRLTFEGNLVGDLLFEIQGQVGALPLLQFTLYQLFERRSGHRLTLQAYHEIGGVKGALAQHAEKTYTSLPTEEHRRLARALFLRLIEPGATEQDTTRRRAALTEFVFADAKQTIVMSETIDAFVAARLLMTNDIAGVRTIEVSHEAVIREWPRLAGWLKEAREDIPLQQAVSDDAEEWVRRDRPNDRLYRGTQLKEAQSWSARYMVSASELAFLRASERQRRLSFFRVIAGALLLLLLGIPTWQLGSHVWQTLQSHVVDNLNSDGTGSLQDVVSNAIDGSTITFRPGLKGIITLSHNLILDKHLILHGPGDGDIVISSGNNNQNYQISVSGQSVLIDGLGFENSVLGTNFIHNTGDLTLAHSIISGIKVSNDLINNENGTLTITNSTISDNIAASFSIIYNNGTHSKLFIKESQILKNNGCNIYNDASNTVIVENSTISDNMNCGGFYNKGLLTIRNSTISGNGNTANSNGGGITNESGGTLTITNSTISGNTADASGGGIANVLGSTLTITNSTISGNTADASGGGIANLSGKTLLSCCTIYGNRAKAGGGIVVLAGTVTLSKSIVAGNTLFAGKQPFHPHIMGTLLSQGYNLIQNMKNVVPKRASTQDTSNIAFSHFTPAHDRTVSTVVDLTKILFDPQGLQNNGGPTETYLLLPSSDNPAIDAIPQDACVDDQGHRVITDQRNMPRPDKNEKDGQRCDIGAYESSD